MGTPALVARRRGTLAGSILGQARPGEATQLLLHQRKEFFEGRGIALSNRAQQAQDLSELTGLVLGVVHDSPCAQSTPDRKRSKALRHQRNAR